MPGSDCSDFFTDEQGYKCFACICLYISKDWAFRLLTRPDCSRSQAWLEVNFDAQEHDLEDWLCHLKDPQRVVLRPCAEQATAPVVQFGFAHNEAGV